jgi:hypothetical protein
MSVADELSALIKAAEAEGYALEAREFAGPRRGAWS